MARELFVYYHVRAVDRNAALQAVLALQADLRRRFPTLIARLLCRAEPESELQTWMETYAIGPAAGAGITDAMQRQIEARAESLAPLLAGIRHVECFVAHAESR